MATYSVTAALCPPLVTPASLLVPGTNPAEVSPPIQVGDTSALVTKAQVLAAMLDVTGRRGGGAFAVTEGLDITASALTCTATAGQALIGGVVTLGASATVTLADNAYNWIWLLQTGQLAKTSSASTTPPAAPSAACAFLGRIQVTAGTPGTPDYSGRWELRNGTLWRRTGDAGIPGDSPASTLLFVTVTAGGTYLWTGLAYVLLPTPGAGLPGLLDTFDVSSPAQITADQNNYSLSAVAGTFRLSTDASRTATGFAGGSAGRRVNLINVGAQNLIISNQSASSTAANRVITGTGADVTLLPDQSAVLWYDGTTARWRMLG